MSLSNNFPTVGPVLNLDFLNSGVLDPRITFTRASTATYFDQLGVLQTAQNNIARFDYNPSTRAAQGLLIEEQRTNLLVRSAEFDNASWAKTNGSISANATTAPDGTTSADKFIPDNGISGANIGGQTVSFVGGIAYTLSIFAKAAEFTSITVLMTTGPSGFGGGSNAAATFDLSNGTVSQVERAGTTAGIQDAGNGWYRLLLTATPTLAHNFAPQVVRYNPTGNGVGGVFIWGAQLEAGAFSTSYIPTTTTALTRQADVASMTGTNFSSWYNASEGTFVAQVIYNADAACKVVFINDGTYNNIFSLQREASLDRWQTDIFSATSRQALLNFATNSASVGFVSKCASVYKVNDFAGSANGGAVITDTSGLVQASVDRLALGRDNVGSAEFLNGYIQRISYYNYRATNAQLQALTGS